MDTTSPGFARGMFAPRTAVAARATGGPSTSLPAASCSGAVCLGLCRRRCWVGGFDEGPFGVCSVGLLRARPVSPLGDGMICPHDASCTLSYDVLCHNPPGLARGHGLLAQAHTSEPAISRGALPCAVSRRTRQDLHPHRKSPQGAGARTASPVPGSAPTQSDSCRSVSAQPHIHSHNDRRIQAKGRNELRMNRTCLLLRTSVCTIGRLPERDSSCVALSLLKRWNCRAIERSIPARCSLICQAICKESET